MSFFYDKVTKKNCPSNQYSQLLALSFSVACFFSGEMHIKYRRYNISHVCFGCETGTKSCIFWNTIFCCIILVNKNNQKFFESEFLGGLCGFGSAVLMFDDIVPWNKKDTRH